MDTKLIQVSSASTWNYYLETHILKVNSLCKHYNQQCYADEKENKP